MDYLHNVFFIINLKRSYKWHLLKDYLKLLFIAWKTNYKSLKEPKSIRFLDFKIQYNQLNTFIFLIEEIFIHECYNSLKTDHNTIIDIGSHIGISTLYFRLNFPNSTIKCYEVDPENFKILYKNIQENNLSGIQLYRKGIDKESQTKFLHKGATDLNSNLKDSYSTNAVQTISIKGIINNKTSLVKIDSEGTETELIDCLIKDNTIKHIRELLIETDKKNRYIIPRLKSVGFKIETNASSFYKFKPETIIRASHT